MHLYKQSQQTWCFCCLFVCLFNCILNHYCNFYYKNWFSFSPKSFIPTANHTKTHRHFPNNTETRITHNPDAANPTETHTLLTFHTRKPTQHCPHLNTRLLTLLTAVWSVFMACGSRRGEKRLQLPSTQHYHNRDQIHVAQGLNIATTTKLKTCFNKIWVESIKAILHASHLSGKGGVFWAWRGRKCVLAVLEGQTFVFQSILDLMVQLQIIIYK